jgi:hypothetical protein
MSKRFSRAMALLLVLSLAGGVWASLVGYWKLDEAGGAVAKDSSGNGNDGAWQGNPTVVDGQFGKALAFSNNRVAISASNSLTANLFQEPFTLVVWINPKRTGNTWQQIFRGVRTDAASNDTLFLNNDGRLSWRGRVATVWAGGMCETAANVVPADQWTHVAVTGDGTNFRIYVNGALSQTSAWQKTDGANATYYIGGAATTTEYYTGMVDDVRVYSHVLTAQEIMTTMQGGGLTLASGPHPADSATDVPADVTLAWTAGPYAATHDVYFGTSFADVNDATRAGPAGVLAGQDQTDAQYVPTGRLTYGQTYYWRVDEVNKAPDNTIFKGGVWSFTVEPYAYPVQPVGATASSAQNDMGPEKTIDGSGMTGDLHGTEPTTMWMSMVAPTHWIQYEFDKAYHFHDLKVWNSNQLLEGLIGFGAKSVTIEYSTDGTTWTALANVPEFARAPGSEAYAANTTVDLAGIQARFIKLTITANWGGVAPQTGLAEVRFTYTPIQAFAPQPAASATGVPVDATLTWRPGREATSHQVYFGTDPNAVANGTVTARTLTDHSYVPDPLNFGTAYYWKIDEVNAVTYPGEVWSFTTEAYKLVEDFESYTDKAGQEVFSTWIDGFDNPKANGALVGLDTAQGGTFGETTILHGGKQSMPLRYDNSTGAPASEAVWTFDLPQDWTANGIRSLSLWFRGTAGNTGQLYIKIDKVKVAYNGAATDIAQALWLPWNIDLSTTGAGLGKVTSLTIGVEGAGAKGTLYFDDIRLYPKLPEFITPVQPDQTNLVARYTFDGDFRDSAGSHHGTPSGTAKIVSDPVRGQVVSLNGTNDKVDIPYSADLNPEAFTVSLWAWADPTGSNYRSPLTARDGSPQRGYILYIAPDNTWQFWTGTGTGWHTTTGPVAQLGEWTHVAATFVNDQKTLYLNGHQVAQGTGTLSLNTQRPLWIGAGATESTGNYYFKGLIDEVRLYNRALSAEEIAGLAGQTKPLAKPF